MSKTFKFNPDDMDDEEKREKLVRKLAKAEKLRMRELERKEKELEKDLLKAFSP